MTQQVINIGTTANDGTGDPLRTAFSKSKSNFAELYALISNTFVVSFASSVTATLLASQNDYAPTGWAASVTNRLLLAPPSGGGILTGLAAAADGWSILIRNTSSTDLIQFNHQSSSSALGNRFWCPGAVAAQLPAGASTVLSYVVNQWVFAS